jgi:hypothetical protein
MNDHSVKDAHPTKVGSFFANKMNVDSVFSSALLKSLANKTNEVK